MGISFLCDLKKRRRLIFKQRLLKVLSKINIRVHLEQLQSWKMLSCRNICLKVSSRYRFILKTKRTNFPWWKKRAKLPFQILRNLMISMAMMNLNSWSRVDFHLRLLIIALLLSKVAISRRTIANPRLFKARTSSLAPKPTIRARLATQHPLRCLITCADNPSSKKSEKVRSFSPRTKSRTKAKKSAALKYKL